MMTGKTSEVDARLVEAVEVEQRILAHGLHDDLCQTLAGAGMRIDVLLQAAKANKPMIEDLAALKRIVEEAIDQTRSLSKHLNPMQPELEGFGLMRMLHDLAADVSRRIPCEFQCERPVSVTKGPVAHTLFRIAQECCRFDHPSCSLERIRLRLLTEREFIKLEVSYEGEKLSDEKTLQGSELMHARARLVGGKLDFGSNERRAKISCAIPV